MRQYVFLGLLGLTLGIADVFIVESWAWFTIGATIGFGYARETRRLKLEAA